MKQLLVLFFLLCSATVFAQDVIVKKDGSTILSKVLEVNQNEVKYKNHNNLNGPTYTISKSELQAINYQNGAKDTFSAPVREENRYLPNNQNDGVQQYNDNALMRIDKASNITPKTTKFLRITGTVIGLLGVGVAVYALVDNGSDSGIIAASAGGGGLLVASGCFVLANIYKKNYNERFYTSSLPLYTLPLSDKTSICANLDIINDHSVNNRSLGIGLRYNF